MSFSTKSVLNFRISTKLAVMSAIGILLVIGMIAIQWHGGSATSVATESAIRQATISRNMIEAKASERGMQIGVRDIRLATTAEQLDRITKYLEARHQSIAKFVTESLALSTSKENAARMTAANEVADQYLAGGKEIADIKAKSIALRTNSAPDAEGAKQAALLNEQADRIAREKTLPLAEKMEEAFNQTVAFSIERSGKAADEAKDDMAFAQRNGLIIGVIAVSFMFGTAVFGAMAIARPLRNMAGVLVELTNDRIVDVPYTARGDEIGEIAKATEVFKQSIADKITNLRVRNALDTCETNVMVADENYNIVYMNNTMIDMMRANEAELRKDLPNLDTKALIGTCIDVFHKNPLHQRGILDKMTTTVRTSIKIAGLQFDLVVTPTIDKHGKRAGTVVEWKDVTKSRALEETAIRVRSALDTCATNIMVADENYNIIYMNQTMMEMMQSNEANLRKELPALDTKKLLGTCIDVFHKNPAHQRGMLDKLSTTLQTDLQLAGLNFHLVVSPIVDKNGKRLGTTVEWKDETAEKLVERQIDSVVQAAVAGDFSQRISIEGKKGFMLNLANAINGLGENTGRALDDLAQMLGSLSEGDLTPRISAEYQGMFGKLKSDANAMADKLTEIVSQIKAGSGEVANAAAEISTGTTDLSQRTEEQAASLEQTSASMEEISATVKKNAENAQQANQSASSTREVAARGGEVVGKTVEAMARIEESSRKISDIISVIDEIARQTNLLALNAAVEAARAGDAGRGFAVVASEVRSLAQRSSQAAKDIKDLINNSTTQVKDGVDLVNRAGEQLKEIVESIKGVASIVSEIASASAEQASGIEQVNKALAQMDEVTQQNSALVEENAASAKTLEQQSAAMNERVAFFRLDGSDTGVAHSPAASAPKQSAAAPPKATKPNMAVAAKANGSNGAAARSPARRMQTALATAIKDDPDWKEF
jgi:methyl-accepting chemotaxis protein